MRPMQQLRGNNKEETNKLGGITIEFLSARRNVGNKLEFDDQSHLLPEENESPG